jgi:hypothetical protein
LGVVDDHGPAVLDGLADEAAAGRHERADQFLADLKHYLEHFDAHQA